MTSVLVQVFGRWNAETIRALWQPASEKRQGRKSRSVVQRRRRCIVPVYGFFEWKAIKGQKAKQPYAIAMKDGSPFGLGGVASGSLVLIAFGLDSVVELISAGVLMWRLSVELRDGYAFSESTERIASRIGGALLITLAAYVVITADLESLDAAH